MIDNLKNPIIGIDLGTTYSTAARWDGTRTEVYRPKGEETMPSVVFLDPKSEELIAGKIAMSKGLIEPQNLCTGIKRYMDQKDYQIKLGRNNYNPIELSAVIIKTIYNNVKGMFPDGVFNPSGVVITVPYYFRANQCSNTEEAAKLAGLKLTGIIQEPIAAAFAYGLHLSGNTGRSEKIIVFDLGGGTFDLTMFSLLETETEINIVVLATEGDDRLGGLDFDRALFNFVLMKNNISLDALEQRKKNICTAKLMEQIIYAKQQLSFVDQVPILVSDVPPGSFLDYEITIEDFNECISKYMEKIKCTLERLIEKSGVGKHEISKVIKVGGSTRIRFVDSIIEEVVGDNKIYGDIDPQTAVACGAAIYGAYVKGELEFHKEIKISIITSHSLGVIDGNGNFIELVPRNMEVPFESTLVFTTDTDNMTELDIKVCQGDGFDNGEAREIGSIKVRGLVPAPKETLEIPVTFRFNSDQTVDVNIIQKESNINITKRF